MTLKDMLADKLTKKQLEYVPNSFDILGNKERAVAIIEFSKSKRYNPKLVKAIAKALMNHHKNVKSVLIKKSARKGIFRMREYKLLAGDKNTEVLHKESGCVFKLDPQKTYFSQREGTERLRISDIIKPKSNVMIFFAGAGPFAVIIAKKSGAKNIIGIEINPDAAEYFKENILLNKLKNVEAVLGDVKQEAQRYYKKCNHVLMPLPERAHAFLAEAIQCLSSKGICHYYCFSREEELKNQKQLIRKEARKLKHKVKFLYIQKVLPWGPRIYKYRIDFIVN